MVEDGAKQSARQGSAWARTERVGEGAVELLAPPKSGAHPMRRPVTRPAMARGVAGQAAQAWEVVLWGERAGRECARGADGERE